MDKVLIKYRGNGSSRYDEKVYFESASKIRREKNIRGPLKIGEQVTIKTKARIWKAVVVNVNPDAPPRKRRTVEEEKTAANYKELTPSSPAPVIAPSSHAIENATGALQAQLQAARAKLVKERRSHRVLLENATSSLQAQLQMVREKLEERRTRQVQLEKTTNSLHAQLRSARAQQVEACRSHQLQLENSTSSFQAQLQAARTELAQQRYHQVHLQNATNSLQAQLRAALTALGEERMAHVLTREKEAVAQRSARGRRRARPRKLL